jgi:DNA-binding HxlR family transcriptional regulator
MLLFTIYESPNWYLLDTYINIAGFQKDTMQDLHRCTVHRCTVYNTLDVIGKKWNLLVILSIHKGHASEKRYNQIKKELHGITAKILSARLTELVAAGLIRKRLDNSTTPAGAWYSLTNAGESLIPIIMNIKEWGLIWKFKSKDCEGMICVDCESKL